MKDQYVGDVNDFAKYQLLRLCARQFERLIIAWMLTGSDGRSDGSRIAYLGDPDRGTADPKLFEVLAGLVASGERSVAAVEASGVLGSCTFHSDRMPADAEGRAAYFAALAAHADAESMVFLDPDNGLAVPSAPKKRRGSERYVYWDEIALFRDACCSILIYQHFPRVQRAEYLKRISERLQAELGSGYATFAAYTAHVGFLFGIRRKHVDVLKRTVIDHCGREPLLSFLS